MTAAEGLVGQIMTAGAEPRHLLDLQVSVVALVSIMALQALAELHGRMDGFLGQGILGDLTVAAHAQLLGVPGQERLLFRVMGHVTGEAHLPDHGLVLHRSQGIGKVALVAVDAQVSGGLVEQRSQLSAGAWGTSFAAMASTCSWWHRLHNSPAGLATRTDSSSLP